MNKNYPKTVWVLGAQLDHTNKGVSALAYSTLKCVLNRWTEPEIIIRSYHLESETKRKIGEKEVFIKNKALFCGVNLFKPNNIYTLLAYALILKILPFRWLEELIKVNNPYYKDIKEADLILDITGGDSFSDIYGIKRFTLSAWLKLLIILCGNNFVLLPQTYGPFKNGIVKAVARYIIAHTSIVYSRDKKGIEYVHTLLKKSSQEKPIEFIPDVAFVLDTRETDSPIIGELKQHKEEGKVIVGINVSGLLYDKTQEADKKFGLKVDYCNCLNLIIEFFLKQKETVVVLVPHVQYKDTKACQALYEKFVKEYPKKIFLEEEDLDCQQVKYLIGYCNFFLGSRMHSCIAAISQGIPTVGLAYSDKFIGVFDSAEVGDYVVDLRTENEQTILFHINEAFVSRNGTAKNLEITIPKIKKKVLEFFDDVDKRLVNTGHDNK